MKKRLGTLLLALLMLLSIVPGQCFAEEEGAAAALPPLPRRSCLWSVTATRHRCFWPAPVMRM